MRFPNFPAVIRTFLTFSNLPTRISSQSQFKALNPLSRGTVLKSMPTIPFLSSFFGTSSSQKMSYPVQKTDDEWQAVLSKGEFQETSFEISLINIQNNFVSSENRELKLLTLESMTSTCLRLESTPAPPAMRHSTKRTTSSSLAADGLRTLIISLVL